MQYHYIQELVADKEITIELIYIASMLANSFRTAMSINNFKHHKNLYCMTWTNESEKRPTIRSEKRFKKSNPKTDLRDPKKDSES